MVFQNINDPEASQKFQEVAAAFVPSVYSGFSRLILTMSSYEILSDADSRAAYDEHGIEGLSGPQGMDAADIFAQFFQAGPGGAFGFGFGPGADGPRSRRGKGGDDVIPFDVTLEDLYNGKVVRMNMEKSVICSLCKG